MNSQVLKPCPFCGGKSDTHCTAGDYPDWFVECEGCGATVDVTGPQAVEFWNRRATPAPIPDAGEGVEVVACTGAGGEIYTAKLLEIMGVDTGGLDQLMTVAQHNRIVSALQASSGNDQQAQRIGEMEGLASCADKARIDLIVNEGLSIIAQLRSGDFCGPTGHEWVAYKYGRGFSVNGKTLREALDKALAALSAGKDGA